MSKDKGTDVDEVLGFKESHPSYGMLGFYRTTCSCAHPLFGSSIKHRDTIHLVLKQGHKRRNLNQDWYYGGSKLFEVEMSYNQFAQLITEMNCGDGIPVTIRSTQNDWKVPDCPFEDKGELHIREFNEHLEEVYNESKQLIKTLEEKFSTKKTFNKKDQEEILRVLRKINQNIGCNQEFQVEQFQRQMDNTVTEAKGEIESFFQNKMYQIAQQAIVETPEIVLGSMKAPVELEAPRRKKIKK